jgi:uncharacterized membrane protein YozB (DUF420 family)
VQILKFSVVFVFAVVLCSIFSSFSNASSTDMSRQREIEDSIVVSENGTVSIRKTEVNDFTSRFEKKGYEVISFMRRVAQPFAILSILIGLMMIVIGSITGSRMKSAGVLVIVFVIISYIGIVFAPEVLDAIVIWIGR